MSMPHRLEGQERREKLAKYRTCAHVSKPGSRTRCDRPAVEVWMAPQRGKDRLFPVPVCLTHDTIMEQNLLRAGK